MKRRRAVLAAFGIIAVGAAGLGAPAAADPRHGDILDLDCDVLGDVQVVVFSNGRGSPGLVVGSTQVGIPYALDLEGVFTPTGGTPEPFEESWEKPAPRNGRLDHCTFHQEFSDEFGSGELDGEVWISYTKTR